MTTAQPPPDPTRLLGTALRLAAAGHPVFPCVPEAKRPLTRHGLLDATTDERQIRAWWRRTPTANLAIPTGTCSFDVLDVDLRSTGSGYPAFNRLIDAGLVDGHFQVVLTPSGGLHAYFPGTAQNSSSLASLHLDFKATGGYVLTPPSMVNGRRYELAHRTDGPHFPLDWPTVRNLLAPAAPRSRPRMSSLANGIDPLVAWVARLPEGRRNTGTFWAACRAIEQGITDLRPLIEAAVQAGLPYREAARTVRSASRYSTPLIPDQPPPGQAAPEQAS